MDLRITAEASIEERQAVDQLLGPPSLDEAAGRGFRGGNAARSRRDLLLPALHAVQSRIGWISPGAIGYIGERLIVPPAEAYGVATFYHLFATSPQPSRVLHVCDDIACLARGAEQICDQLEEAELPPAMKWSRSPCLGLCERAPAAVLMAAGEQPFAKVLAPAKVLDCLAASTSVSSPEADRFDTQLSVPQAGSEVLRLLRRVGMASAASIDEYSRAGGWLALEKARRVGGDAIVAEVTASGLLGRGGAAFPAGRKWKAVRQAHLRGEQTCLVVNADESEPGTFKDRVLMEGDPFALIESMCIAALAVGARKGWIYLRGEYPFALQRLQNAIDQSRQSGVLGGELEIEIRRGAGAYICGEETALFNSIEGYRGEPRNKPPFPVESGLFGLPTLATNVETIMNVPQIILGGGDAFARVGTAQSTGTKLFCLSGHVARPGVYEFPLGVTLRDVINAAGGATGQMQAVLVGGAAGTFVTPDELDMVLTFEGTRAAGASLGSAVVMVFDSSVDLKRIILRIAEFFREESCGQCVPCRVGTVRQDELLHSVSSSPEAATARLAMLDDVARVMTDASICGLGHTAASAIQSALKRWRLFR